MKKNILIKGILLLIVISLMGIGLTGCVTVTPTPTTGTVYIIVTGGWFYNLYIDYTQYFGAVAQGTYTVFNVPIGSHFFEAEHTWGWIWGYASVTQYISAGANYVYLYP